MPTALTARADQVHTDRTHTGPGPRQDPAPTTEAAPF